jgi:hypothetical protein
MRSGRVILSFILAPCFAIGLALILIAPFRSFPDETAHLEYAQYIHVNHTIPPLATQIKDIKIQESFQPPLFYICSSVLVFPNHFSFTVIAIRVFCLLLGIGTIFLAWKCAQLVWPGFPPFEVLACSFIAFNPQFIWNHCGISNLSMTSLTSAICVYFALRTTDKNRNVFQNSVFLGIAFGAALLSRVITIYLLPVCGFVILHRARKDALLPLILFVASTLMVCGWWFGRNWIEYGDPLLWHIHQTTMGLLWARDVDSFQLKEFLGALAFLHATFWAYFGRNQFHAGIAEYALYLMLVVLAAAGTMEIVFRRTADADFNVPRFCRSRFLILVMAGIFAVSEIVLMQLKIASPQGRYLYMAYVPIAIISGCGLLKIIPAVKRKSAANWISAFLFLFCIYLLMRYALPHYL